MTKRRGSHPASRDNGKRGGANLTQKVERRDRGQIAELVRTHRKEKGMSLDDLARLTGLSRSYLGDIEAGRKGSNMSSYTLNELSRALAIAPHLLCMRAGENSKNSYVDARKYGEHYRVLRSNIRARQVGRLLARIRAECEAAKVATVQGKDASKMLQTIESTVEAIDNALAYRGKPPVSVRPTAETGDDEKFFGKSG